MIYNDFNGMKLSALGMGNMRLPVCSSDLGSDMPEDMTIPVLLCGKHFPAGKDLGVISIKDIAPTIVTLLDAPPAPEWEGKSLVERGECYGATCG